MTSCAKCHEALEIEVDPDGDDDIEMDTTQTVPDDVILPCACHFHWECLLESYELAKCPNCSRDIVSVHPQESSSAQTPQEQIIVDLNNEGGMQEQIDIFPILKEESYLRAYPEERKCRVFLEFCKEGDYRAIVDLMKSCSEEEEGEEEEGGLETVHVDRLNGVAGTHGKSADEILRYQDPIGDMQSGLHAAAANGHREVAWLLLLLASSFPEMEIPAIVFQEAATLGMMREDQEGKVDIRSLEDAHGQTAEDLAREAGVIWTGWIDNGRLAER